MLVNKIDNFLFNIYNYYIFILFLPLILSHFSSQLLIIPYLNSSYFPLLLIYFPSIKPITDIQSNNVTFYLSINFACACVSLHRDYNALTVFVSFCLKFIK